ncbi:MAG: DUF6377 domain-containing protein [Muribaculaceae bacterium]|nr:DUF6377 domain-containing protein [Muribaculaceae bacterium]
MLNNLTKHIAIFIFMVLSVLAAHAQNHVPMQALLDEFDTALEHSRERVAVRIKAVDSLKMSLPPLGAGEVRVSALVELGQEYMALSADSAMKYLTMAEDMARELGLHRRAEGIAARRCNVMALQGQEALSVSTFESINPDSIDEADRVLYHFAGERIYVMLLDKARGGRTRKRFNDMCRVHNNALLRLVPDTAAIYDLVMATRYKLDNKLSMQLAHLTNLMGNDNVPSQTRANAAFWLGTYYQRHEGSRSDDAGYYYLLAAIMDMHAGIRTGLALYALSSWLHENGDEGRSERALRAAVDNSRDGNVVNPWVSTPQLAGIAIESHDRSRNRLRWEIGCLLVLLICAVLAGVDLYRRKQKLKHERQVMLTDMRHMHESREQHVTQFLNLCGIYMKRLGEYDLLVRRKIAAGQTDELYKLLKSGKLLSEQGEMFYAVFDNAFLHLYPDFVEYVNNLLLPDKRIVVEGEGKLTPELRILAFSILGLDDTQRVAKFLGLSVNTIYAYRNKLRSRAADRDAFDAAITVLSTHRTPEK